MYIAILGRLPSLSMAELEKIYGSEKTSWFSPNSALVNVDLISVERLGGTQKAGRVILDLPRGDWRQASMKIVSHYVKTWQHYEGKITLGISAYGFSVSPRDVQKTGLVLKQRLKNSSGSLRLIPNQEPALNTAASHHNKLGLSENKIELLVVRGKTGRIIVAESVGAQNITNLANRDQGRPKRDTFVGMLPPKLAQIMINLAFANGSVQKGERPGTLRLLDPFCGTGVVLQEAALMGYEVYGTDLSEKMIDYSKANLQWLASGYHFDLNPQLHQGDAMTTTWEPPIDLVVCESYLGQPFSAPPSPEKLDQVRKNCNHIIGSFLKNIAAQVKPGTTLCIAVPAWRDTRGNLTHLPLINNIDSLGFKRQDFQHINSRDLIYYREDQVVARELLVLVKT